MVKKKVKSKVKKSVSTKKSVKKKPMVRKQVTKTKSHATAIKKTVPVEPPRAPQRKILRDDKTIHVVKAPVVMPIVVPEESLEQVRVLKVKPAIVPVAKKESINASKVDWEKLPQSLPPQMRFYVSMARKECLLASSWPFPFAKFISELPQRLCGYGFSVLLMSLDHDIDYIASVLKSSKEDINELLRREGSQLLDACESLCPEVFRKIKTQLGGVGVSIDTLIERYIVQKVDRNFQLTAGALVLKALSVNDQI